ncbi:uncharacterized protein LOC134777714 [Penaeus indicus]|uniref:uncharacterized protein LOC134777714 n=1 Tax=Penaeus indicus TaxID=29960 RepID=UPI00300DA5D4
MVRELKGQSTVPSDVTMLRIVSLAVTLAVCVARPNQWDDQLGLFPADGGDSQPILPRAVANPTTPNQILDAVLEGAIAYMETLGWCDSKNVQNGESNLPFQVNSDGSSSENFSITKANVTGLCSLRRSKSASFNADQSVLSGSVVVENARANADYTVTFAGVGEAPAQTVSGQVVERVDKLFADIQINLLNLVPQNIASYSARSGHDLLESASNLNGNDMKDVHSAGFRKALREIVEKTMSSNVKHHGSSIEYSNLSMKPGLNNSIAIELFTV